MGFLTPQDWLHSLNAIGGGFRNIAHAAKKPLDMYDNIAGAGQRAVAGAISGRGIVPSVMHQDQSQDITHAAEARLGLPHSGKGLGSAIEDFGFQTVTDPVTYVPGLDFFSVGGRLAKASKLGERLEHVPIIDRFLGETVEGHHLRKAVTRSGENIVKGHESAGRNARNRMEQHYQDVVTLHADELNQGIIHPEVRHALQQRAFREGTPRVRRQVLASGYHPTPEERSAPVLNILHTYKGAEYVPKQRLSDDQEKLASDLGYASAIKQGNKSASYNATQHLGDESTPLSERVLDRLLKGTYLENYHATRHNILRDLGLNTRPNINRAEQRLAEAQSAGDTRASNAYQSLLARQKQSAMSAFERQAQHLKPGAEFVSRTLAGRNLDEDTALARARREIEGNPNIPGGESIRGPLQGGLALEKNVGQVKAQFQRELANANKFNRLATKVRGADRNVGEKIDAMVDQSGRRGRKAVASVDAKLGNSADNRYNRAIAVEQKLIEQAKKLAGEKKEVGYARSGGGLDQKFDNEIQTLVGSKGQGILRAINPLVRDAVRDTKDVSRPSLLNSIANAAAPRGIDSIKRTSKKGVNSATAAASESAINAMKYGKRLVDTRNQNSAIRAARKLAKGDLSAANDLTIPAALDQRLFGDIIKPNASPLRDISDASRDALFGATSLPHKKNISVMQMMGPAGAKGLVRGMGYARKLKRGDPSLDERVKGLESIGGTEHFIRDTEPVYEKFGKLGKFVAKRAHVVNKSLDRFETGQRLALQDELARRGKTGFDAGGEIRDILGDYKNQAPIVDELRNRLGAPFPGWHLGVVPRAAGRAIMKEPRRVRALVRSQNDFNSDVMEPQFNADFHLGGPLNEGLDLYSSPFGAKHYLSSESVTGPIGEAGRDIDALSKGKVGSVASDLARSYIPGAAQVEDLTNLSPYKGVLPGAATTAAGMMGSYFTKAESGKAKLRDKMLSNGVPKKTIDMLLRSLSTK